MQNLSRTELKIYLKVLQDPETWNRELIKAVKNGLNVEQEIEKVKVILNSKLG